MMWSRDGASYLYYFCLSLAILGFPCVASAISLDVPAEPNYALMKQSFVAWSARHPSSVDRARAVRAIAQSSRYGQQGTERIFRGFRGVSSLDPGMPGLQQALLLLHSSSESQAKGAMRELLVAQGLRRHPEFSVQAIGERVARSWGKTDKDVVFRSHGIQGRIEVKNVIPRSQVADIDRLLGQIKKMGRERALTGEMQVLWSRYSISPQIKSAAQQAGVLVYDNVSSGRTRPASGRWEQDCLDDIARHCRRARAARVTGIGFAGGVGTYALVTRSIASYRAFNSGRPLEGIQHGAGGLAGGGLVMTAGSETATWAMAKKLSQRGLTRLRWVAKGGIAVTVVFTAAEQGVAYYRYGNGNLSPREYSTMQAGLVGSGVGGVIGGGIGFALGLLEPTPFGEVAGTLGGASIGGGIGGVGGEVGAGYYYDWKYGDLEHAVQSHVLAHYAQ